MASNSRLANTAGGDAKTGFPHTPDPAAKASLRVTATRGGTNNADTADGRAKTGGVDVADSPSKAGRDSLKGKPKGASSSTSATSAHEHKTTKRAKADHPMLAAVAQIRAAKNQTFPTAFALQKNLTRKA